MAGLGLTAVVAAVPSVYFAYRAPVTRAVLETAEALVGTLVAFLCFGRYRRHRRAGDLAIVLAMTLLALDYPLFGTLPRMLSGTVGEFVGKWTPLGAWVAAAALLATASVLTMSGRHVPEAASTRWAALLAPIAIAGLAAVVLVLVGSDGTDRLLPPELAERPSPLADPLVAAIQLAAAGLFAVAAARFSAARLASDRFVDWIGTGSALGAVASLNYALFPSLSSSLLHIGDLLQAGAVIAWSFAALEEIAVYWSEVARLAQAEERRRLARDLHDGAAQELAFLVSHSRAPSSARAHPEWLAQLRASAERGLAESRRAIHALSADAPLPLEQDLARTAEDIAGRAGARVNLAVTGTVLEPGQQETVVRIVREAVTNATRHGRATRITIQFTSGSRPVLRVCDNGVGFDPADAGGASGGFGLMSMRERAETLGATLAVRSARGEGTIVEVSWH
jgi:signal transduction histidine kinase